MVLSSRMLRLQPFVEMLESQPLLYLCGLGGPAPGLQCMRSLHEPDRPARGICIIDVTHMRTCLLYTSPSPRDAHES
eukprot:176623-Prymnesium_polylepis.6